MASTISTIDEYINQFPNEIKNILIEIRSLIHKAAPDATEKISYQMPTFFLNGNLVHFAAFKNHIGFYPTPSGTTKFQKEIAIYKSGKGSIQFPYNEPLPKKLIMDIVKYRVEENNKKRP
jgi:uncharacterized protein YdhG (YjbR/CyaY superfamily)